MTLRSLPALNHSSCSGLNVWVQWIRARDRASTASPPRHRGSIAACSRNEPWPYVLVAHPTPRRAGQGEAFGDVGRVRAAAAATPIS
jgi:hypothetical protein